MLHLSERMSAGADKNEWGRRGGLTLEISERYARRSSLVLRNAWNSKETGHVDPACSCSVAVFFYISRACLCVSTAYQKVASEQEKLGLVAMQAAAKALSEIISCCLLSRTINKEPSHCKKKEHAPLGKQYRGQIYELIIFFPILC